MSLYTVVRYQVQGFHFWPDAPDHRIYLRNRHRHVFHVEVKLGVNRADREVEFHDLLDYCKGVFDGGELRAQSCEMMAQDLGQKITGLYPGRCVEVSIFEDGENGAIYSNNVPSV